MMVMIMMMVVVVLMVVVVVVRDPGKNRTRCGRSRMLAPNHHQWVMTMMLTACRRAPWL
jgi:hypothetical protein